MRNEQRKKIRNNKGEVMGMMKGNREEKMKGFERDKLSEGCNNMR